MARVSGDIYDWMPVSRKMQYLAHDTLENIARNFETQGIFPSGEAWKGWFAENARNKYGRWHSTGAGIDSFRFQLDDALAGVTDPTAKDVTMSFFFNYYLKFVDMGVERGRSIESVARTRPANHNVRYSQWGMPRYKWDKSVYSAPREHLTHRPAIMMEFRHTARRMQMYFGAATARYAPAIVITKFKEMEDINLGII